MLAISSKIIFQNLRRKKINLIKMKILTLMISTLQKNLRLRQKNLPSSSTILRLTQVRKWKAQKSRGRKYSVRWNPKIPLASSSRRLNHKCKNNRNLMISTQLNQMNSSRVMLIKKSSKKILLEKIKSQSFHGTKAKWAIGRHQFSQIRSSISKTIVMKIQRDKKQKLGRRPNTKMIVLSLLWRKRTNNNRTINSDHNMLDSNQN